MTTSPPQPPQGPYSGQPAGYGPPPQQFPQYGQQDQQTQQQGQQYGAQPGQQQAPQYQGQPGPYQQQYAGQQAPQYGQYQQPGQQGQFQQGQFPQGQSFPQPGYAAAPQGQLTCRFCGGFPAEQATVRGHQGMIILMRFLKLQGPFCRTCGIASVRDMTSKSLWQGWWGIGSSIVNPITMLMNIGPMQKFKRLPEPQPGPGRPMDPGKPLFRRPAILMLLLPIVVVALLVVSNLNSVESSTQVGACVVNKGTSTKPNVKVVDCSSSDAEYRVIDKINSTDESQCGDNADATYVDEGANYTLCLAKIK